MQQELNKWWVIHSCGLLYCFAAGEEGFIETHKRSVTLSKYKTTAK